MKWIRDNYGVPAKRGGRIAFEGRPGRITAARGSHLRAQLDDGAYVILHPTWHVEYLADQAEGESND